jgi:Flp pilus assembly protein TadG
MHAPQPPSSGRRDRSGKTLVQLVLALPVLLGMIGLVIDGGILMASQRQVQNAADAAALGAAMDMYRGSSGTALATANTFVTDNGMTGVTLALNSGSTNTLNIPPTQGPYASNGQYAEAIVTKAVPTVFIQILTGTSSNQVSARAVAGYEPVSSGEGAIVLDPTATPGISIGGNNTRLIVNGTIVVNSQGSGYDQYGGTVTTPGYSQPALTTSGSPTPAPIVARDVQVVGGVDALTTIDNIRTYDPAFSSGGYYYDSSNTDRPLFARATIQSDPLAGAPTPSVSSGSTPPDIGLTGGTTTLSPGVYRTISISNNANVTFNPGIYVVGAGFNGGGNTLDFNGGATISVGAASGGISGVLFYNAGSTYTTAPEADNGATAPGNSTKFGKMNFNGGSGTLTPYNNANNSLDPLNGILLYQSRWNTQTASIAGGSTLGLTGTIYAKRANFALSGGGTFNAQFVVGSMAISGGATLTINATGKNFGRANQIFLVE